MGIYLGRRDKIIKKKKMNKTRIKNNDKNIRTLKNEYEETK